MQGMDWAVHRTRFPLTLRPKRYLARLWLGSSACTHALSVCTKQAAGYTSGLRLALRRCPALCALGLTMTDGDFFFPVVKAQMNQQGCTLQHLQLCLALDLYTLMEHSVVSRLASRYTCSTQNEGMMPGVKNCQTLAKMRPCKVMYCCM